MDEYSCPNCGEPMDCIDTLDWNEVNNETIEVTRLCECATCGIERKFIDVYIYTTTRTEDE